MGAVMLALDPEIVRQRSRGKFVRRSGGLFRDMMIHDLDMACWLLAEEPVEIFARGSVLVDPAIGEAGDFDTAVASLRMPSGALCQIAGTRRAVYGYDRPSGAKTRCSPAGGFPFAMSRPRARRPRGAHMRLPSPGTGRITAPESSSLQSIRSVRRKRRPTSKVDSMTVFAPGAAGGIYTITHDPANADMPHEVTVIKGRWFPISRHCRGITFELAHAAKHVGEIDHPNRRMRRPDKQPMPPAWRPA